MINILVAQTEKQVCDRLQLSLTRAGYHCVCVCDGVEAANSLENQTFDLIILETSLPGISGFELMDYIRTLNIPAIFLSDSGDLDDKVRGLRMGAEDYIVKPFEMPELMARAEGVLRRHGKLESVISIGGVEINTVSMTVTKSGEKIALTKKEYDLLLMFARNPGIVLYKDTLYERVWGGEYPDNTRTVELHIQRMRKKVGWEELVRPVYSIGYRLEI